MTWIVVKYGLTAAIVVAVSEFARRSDRLGALIGALPMVTILALIWLHLENQPEEKLANHAALTFWYVLPSLPMFLLFPFLLPRIGFWPTLAVCAIVTFVCFAVLVAALRRIGIALM